MRLLFLRKVWGQHDGKVGSQGSRSSDMRVRGECGETMGMPGMGVPGVCGEGGQGSITGPNTWLMVVVCMDHGRRLYPAELRYGRKRAESAYRKVEAGWRPPLGPVAATARQQDVRATEIDKVVMYDCFRPGDIVRAEVRSYEAGDRV